MSRSVSKEQAARMALAMYADEPCRICGENIDYEDVGDIVWAGCSKGNEARAAHGHCWGTKPKAEWAYPEDAEHD